MSSIPHIPICKSVLPPYTEMIFYVQVHINNSIKTIFAYKFIFFPFELEF